MEPCFGFFPTIIPQFLRSNNSKARTQADAGTYFENGEAMKVGMYCTKRGRTAARRGGSKAKTIGIVLMAAGMLVLLLFVPCWVWTSLLALLLISIGFLIWRFS